MAPLPIAALTQLILKILHCTLNLNEIKLPAFFQSLLQLENSSQIAQFGPHNTYPLVLLILQMYHFQLCIPYPANRR